MNRKSFFRLAWALTLLLAFSLGCKMVSGAQELITLATDMDVEGLATEMDLEGISTQVEALSTQIDLEGLATDINVEKMATEMAPVLTEMESFLTDMPEFDETLMAASTPAGFPEDIPVMDGPKLNMSGTPNRLEYTIDTDLAPVVEYYRREMAARGWVEGASNVQEGEANLVFQKGARRAAVKISEDFLFGMVIEITVEG